MSDYRELFNSLDVGFCIIDVIFDGNKKAVDYRFIEMNRAFENQTGLTDAGGKTVRELVPNLEEHWFEIYGKVAATGESVQYENIAESLGRYYDVYAYRFGNPKENKVAVIFNDIKEKKLALENLKKTESRFRTTLDNMIEGCAIIGFDWTYLYVNEMNAKHAHLPREEMIGHKMTDVLPGVENSVFYSCYKRCMDERIYQQVEDHYVFADGSEGWYQSIAHPVPEGIFVLSMEITTRKNAELERNKILQELQISESKLKNAMRIANMGHVEVDLVTGNIFWSDEVFKIFQRPAEAGQPGFEDAIAYIHPDDKERVLKTVQGALTDEIIEVDYRIQLPGGRIKYLAYYMAPIFADGKQVKRVGTVQDITERKLTEMKLQQKVQEKEVLLKELYHRIKNNMQIISSLLTLRAGAISNEEDRNIFLNLKNHVHAMSLVHEKLYQSKNLSRINLGSYIKDLCETLLLSYSDITTNVQVSYDIQEVDVMIDVALPCGFIITELIHNILKHAFPGKRKGNIKISLSRGDTGIMLLVSDDGIGIPDQNAAGVNQLGLLLVRTLVEDQLSGELTLDNSNGTCWNISIKENLYEHKI